MAYSRHRELCDTGHVLTELHHLGLLLHALVQLGTLRGSSLMYHL